jgi:hypothetical protein
MLPRHLVPKLFFLALAVTALAGTAAAVLWFSDAAPLWFREQRFLDEFSRTPRAERRALFDAYLARADANRLLDALEDKFPRCHGQAHELGQAVFAATRDLNQALASCRDRCTGGCFHGVLMEAFRDVVPARGAAGHVELAQLKDKVNDVCRHPLVADTFRPGNCPHAVGHALMFLSGYVIPEALAACELFDDRRLALYCAGGAYMEYDIVYGEADRRTKSPHYPCDADAPFPVACYSYRGRYLLEAFGSVALASAECARLENPYARGGCFRGLGFTQLDEVAEQPAVLTATCRYGTTDDQIMCVEGAIEKLADFDEAAAHRACQQLTGDVRVACEAAAAQHLYTLDKSFRRYLPDAP